MMPLLFGIPSLDELIDIPGSDEATSKPPKSDASSLALLGPDGSGKSVLALHLASYYRAWCCQNIQKGALPKVLYVSSDLQFESAQKVWRSFSLHEPFNRHVPFERIEAELYRRYRGSAADAPCRVPRDHEIDLMRLTPIDDVDDATSVAKFLLDSDNSASLPRRTAVGFLDLAHHTAGDDWNLVNSLIVNLQGRPRPQYGEQTISHLVIIDSVAGFETFMGTYDAYGMEQSRRARIAQSMRNAHPHAHLVFVVEEPDEGKRLPEEYVTDVVVRLRTRRNGTRPIRTVEVEKARARNHAMGEHVFEIRNLNGSSTGLWENPDTPITDNNYVHVFHSFSHRNVRVNTKIGRGRTERKGSVAPIGLAYLDRLLEPQTADAGSDPWSWGLRSGSTAALIGDTGTGKSVLGEMFLANGFTDIAEHALNMYFVLAKAAAPATCRQTLDHVLSRLRQPVLVPGGVAPPETSSSFTGELSDLLGALAAAWQEGEEASARNLEQMPKPNPATSQFDRGSVECRQAALRARRSKRKNPKSRSGCYAEGNPLTESERPASYVEALFRHPNLRSPAILFTTSDRTAELLAQRCLGYLAGTIERCLSSSRPSAAVAKRALILLRTVIEEQLIVRRADIDNVPGSAFYDMVQRSVIQAQYLIHGPYFPADQAARHARADRIRVVIDDMRVLSNLCPAVADDSAFLPYMVFDLEREGVTTLIVHTDDLRPGMRPTDPVSQKLISLLKQLILTWSAPFEGQSRIAISAIPATSKDTNGIVREVEVDRLDRPSYLRNVVTTELTKVDVTRHLELYADLESGAPRLVPIAVYLFDSTPACRRYMDQEDVLYRTQFLPVRGLVRNGQSGRVLWPIDATEYFAIRDITHLPWDVKADHTIIDQVDGFWSLDYETGALASQRAYLTERNRSQHEDSFGLFRGEPLWSEGQDPAPYARQRYFKNSNYQSRIFDFGLEGRATASPAEHPLPNRRATDRAAAARGRLERQAQRPLSEMPDRVPFTWDFGFILVPIDPWDRARTRPLTTFEADTETDFRDWPASRTVGGICDELTKPWRSRKQIGWRPFFGACKEVADQARKERGISPVPFDFAATSAETLLSMILEIWFSEIARVTKSADYAVDRRFSRAWERWQERLTAKRYQPLPSRSDEAREYSLARLLRNELGDANRRVSIEQRFRDFRDAHFQKVISYCERKNWKAATKQLQEWAAHLKTCVEKRISPDRESFDTFLIVDAVHRYENESFVSVKQRRQTLASLPTAALCLYKTWLLLQDVFDFEAALDPASAFETKQPKTPSKLAMAIRHYYRTACHEQARHSAEEAATPQYALAMPGSFSVRGDSFLASAQASRSQLLASNAMDLLCSRRANLTRMQMGIGLPVRDVLRNEQCREMRTALRTKKNDSLDQLRYSELCELGGPPPDAEPEDERLQWLFRNGMPDYDRTSRAIQKWLTRMFRWTIAYREQHVLGWDGGFRAYDALSAGRFAPFVTYTSFDDFAKLCDYLVAEVEAAERWRA